MSPIAASSTAQADALERLARKRAGMRMGWLIHATVFLAVHLLLAGLSAAGGRHGAIFPFLGWGLGLTIHGAVVFLHTGGFGLHERLLQQERNRLKL
ncbi:2TM domain-containing protein [Hydrogenophaga sp.]|uniref:2TM domain-containing protein n=1 Tax=Hydrogenophaga sp. TaxID=1904254 RepID=UPI0035693994